MGEPELLRAADAARVLAISQRKLWEITNRGELRCVRIDRCVRYALGDLRDWIETKRGFGLSRRRGKHDRINT